MKSLQELASQDATFRGIEFCRAIKHYAAERGNASHALQQAERTRAPERVIATLKAAVGAGSIAIGSPGAWGSELQSTTLMTGFFDSLRSRSTFFRILGDAGFSRQPLRTRMGIVVADATGWIVGAGKPVPLSSMGFDGATLEEHKACALVVCTEELLQATGSAAEAAFGRALRGAVANVVDRHFLNLIGQGITPQAGTASPDADIKTLLDTVNTTGSGSLYWIMTPSLANLLVSLRGAAGTRVFPDMTPLGGSIVGLPALVTTEARAAAGSPATDALWLIDASQIVADATGIEVDMSREATIEMDDAPGMDAVAPTGPTGPLVSLWQQNCAAMMAKVWFGARRLRSNAIAVLEGVNWS